MAKTNTFILDSAALTAPRGGFRSLSRSGLLTPTKRVQQRMFRIASSSDQEPGSSLKDLGQQLQDIDSEKLLKDIQSKWDSIEDKTSVVVYIGGALLLLFLGSSIVSAFDKLPLFPKLFQLIGLIYTCWFVYRYLLFKSSRQELIEDVEELKNKISGNK